MLEALRLGCVIFKGELRASAWKFFQKAVKAELLDAKTCRYEDWVYEFTHRCS